MTCCENSSNVQWHGFLKSLLEAFFQKIWPYSLFWLFDLKTSVEHLLCAGAQMGGYLVKAIAYDSHHFHTFSPCKEAYAFIASSLLYSRVGKQSVWTGKGSKNFFFSQGQKYFNSQILKGNSTDFYTSKSSYRFWGVLLCMWKKLVWN